MLQMTASTARRCMARSTRLAEPSASDFSVCARVLSTSLTLRSRSLISQPPTSGRKPLRTESSSSH